MISFNEAHPELDFSGTLRLIEAAESCPELASLTLDACRSFLGASAGTIFSLPRRDTLELMGSTGYPAWYVTRFRTLALDAPYPLSECVRTGTALWIPTIEAWNARYPTMLITAGSDRKAWATLPLLRNGLVLGSIGLAWTDRDGFDPPFRERAEALAASTAKAVERLLARRPARPSKEELELVALITAGLPIGTWSKDLVTGAAWWSPEIERLFGLPAGAFDGLDSGFTSYLSREHQRLLEQSIDEAVSQCRPFLLDLPYVGIDGETHWLEARGRAVYSTLGEPLALYCVGRDITAQKRVEERLQRQESSAQLSVGMLSHDFKNPLFSIQLQLEAIERHGEPLEAEIRDRLERMQRASSRMMTLVDDLLDYLLLQCGQPLQLHPAPLDLQRLLTRAAHLPSPESALPPILLDLSGNGRVEGDVERLERALSNVLSLLRDRSPEDAPVRVRTQAEEDWIQVELRAACVLAPNDALRAAFEPGAGPAALTESAHSQTLKLRLYLVQQTLLAHRGSVALRSSEAEGTTMVLRLPRRRA